MLHQLWAFQEDLALNGDMFLKPVQKSEKLLKKMPQIRIQVERNVAKEFWSFKKERNLVSFPPKIGNMQPILFLHFCEKNFTEKKKKVISIARSTRRKKKEKEINWIFIPI